MTGNESEDAILCREMLLLTVSGSAAAKEGKV